MTNILESINVQYLEDLANFNEFELSKTRGLGSKTMTELKADLNYFRLDFC